MADQRDDDKDTPDRDGRSRHSLLLVPVHLDALWLDADLSVVDAKVDFSRLPYWDGRREVNRDVANISEELIARPFQDRGLQLKKGVHLHWALPQALTRGAIGEDGTTFPAVPNRWLVTRSRRLPAGNGEDECRDGRRRTHEGGVFSHTVLPALRFRGTMHRSQSPHDEDSSGW